MTPDQYRTALRNVLTGVLPTLPLELADCEQLKQLVLGAFPSGTGVEVYHNTHEILVRVFKAGVCQAQHVLKP